MPDHRVLLEQAGEALYGPRWQSELARGVGVADRTMRRWIADPHEIPAGVWLDIGKMLRKRAEAIAELQERVDALSS